MVSATALLVLSYRPAKKVIYAPYVAELYGPVEHKNEFQLVKKCNKLFRRIFSLHVTTILFSGLQGKET